MAKTIESKLTEIADNSAKYYGLELVSLEKKNTGAITHLIFLITVQKSAASTGKIEIKNRAESSKLHGVKDFYPVTWTFQFDSDDSFAEFSEWCEEEGIDDFKFGNTYDTVTGIVKTATGKIKTLAELDQFEISIKNGFRFFAEQYFDWVAPEVIPENLEEKITKLLTGIAQANNFQLIVKSDYFDRVFNDRPWSRCVSFWLQKPDSLKVYLSINFNYLYGNTKQDLQGLESIKLSDYFLDLLGTTLVSEIKQFNRHNSITEGNHHKLEVFLELYMKIIEYYSLPHPTDLIEVYPLS